MAGKKGELGIGKDIRLLAPIPLPPQIRDSMNFLGHLENAIDGRNRRQGIAERTKQQRDRIEIFLRRPCWYKPNRFSVIGTDREVAWPRYSSYVDYEHELACVLWRGGKDIPVAEAEGHIFGYLNFNDLSARDVQPVDGDMQPTSFIQSDDPLIQQMASQVAAKESDP